MWPAEDVIVISDLHLAAERDSGLFRADEQLAEFLRWVFKNFSRCHLLLNGDVFDFLVGKRPESEINFEEAAEQARAIAGCHEEVFEELSLIASSDTHELIILGGNHDPELALPVVQREIELRATRPCPHYPIRWLTNGEAALLRVGEAKVLVEHGDQYDAWNWIDHETLRRVVCLVSRNISYHEVYRSPPGSRMVVNRFSPLRERFPWIETLQPLTAPLLLLTLEVILPSLSAGERSELLDALKEFSSFVGRSVVAAALRPVNPRAEFWADGDDERQMIREWLVRYEREENVWGAMDDSKAMTAKALARLRGIVIRGALKKISSRDTFFEIDMTDAQYAAVERLIAEGTDLVVHGHTHSAKSYTVGRGLYLNTGTWGQLTKLPVAQAGDDEWADFIEGLRDGRAPSSLRPTFVHIGRQGEAVAAGLYEWQNGRAKPQSVWRFVNHQWQKED